MTSLAVHKVDYCIDGLRVFPNTHPDASGIRLCAHQGPSVRPARPAGIGSGVWRCDLPASLLHCRAASEALLRRIQFFEARWQRQTSDLPSGSSHPAPDADPVIGSRRAG